jgi:hypothetical protein
MVAGTTCAMARIAAAGPFPDGSHSDGCGKMANDGGYDTGDRGLCSGAGIGLTRHGSGTPAVEEGGGDEGAADGQHREGGGSRRCDQLRAPCCDVWRGSYLSSCT